MLHVRQFDEVWPFYRAAMPFLCQNQAENTVLIGILERARLDTVGAGELGSGEPLMVLVEDQNNIIAAAVKTEARSLVLTGAAPGAAEALAGFLACENLELPGVTGPAATATAFAREWETKTSGSAELLRSLRLFQCTEVHPPVGVSGAFSEPSGDALETLVAWTKGFESDCCDHPGENLRKSVAMKLAERSIFVWNDPEPRSMASFTARTKRSARIVLVYTPPEFRNRGYASAVTASLTLRLLNEGLPQCLLFTDLANPTSNNIYRKNGYVPVEDFLEFRFASC